MNTRINSPLSQLNFEYSGHGDSRPLITNNIRAMLLANFCQELFIPPNFRQQLFSATKYYGRFIKGLIAL